MQLNIRAFTNSAILLAILLSWWFTASVIHPELHYYLQQSAFLTNSTFFEGFLAYPGGLADYLSEFIAQFFYYNTWGSFLIILVASLLAIIAIHLVEQITAKGKFRYGIFALFLLLSLLVQCNYHYPFYASIRLLIAFGFVWMLTAIAPKFPRLLPYMSFLLAILLFYVAGGAALMVYSISVILFQIYHFKQKKDWIILPLFALFSIALPYLAYQFIILVNLSLAYSITHSKTPLIIAYIPDFRLYALYALLPACILAAVGLKMLKSKSGKATVAGTKAKAEPAAPQRNDKKPNKKASEKSIARKEKNTVKAWNAEGIWLTVQIIVLAVLAGWSVNAAFDKNIRNQKLVSFYGANGEWDQVIKTAESLKEYDLFANLEYNKALANKGKLADNLFNYAQLAGPEGLFIDRKVTSDIPFICCDQYYDLGFMHESQHWAFEAQTMFPNSPRLLKRLIQINLVNGKYHLAEKFLRQLEDNLLYQDWVSKYQKYIEDTTLVEKDPELSGKRKCEPLEAFTANNPSHKLTELLKANPANKMAIDYLLCALLLDGDLAAFKNLLDNSRSYINAPLPRAWDEALVLYHYMARKEPAPGEISFTKERQKQFISFIKAFKPFGNDWQSARQSLRREFGNTYWYYIKCLNPKVTKAQIKKADYDE